MGKVPPKSFHFDRRIPEILKANVGEPDDLLCTKEIAKLFGISKSWFDQSRHWGYGPEYTKIGWCVYYTRRAITEFLRERLRILAKSCWQPAKPRDQEPYQEPQGRL